MQDTKEHVDEPQGQKTALKQAGTTFMGDFSGHHSWIK
jgi:hypothetical protein